MRRLFVLAALVATALVPAATHASALPRLIANDDKACLIKVVAPDSAGAFSFGQRVAISGETMAVVTDGQTTRTSGRAVYVFVRDSSGWRSQQKIYLGTRVYSVAIAGDTLAAGMDGEVQVWTRSDGVWSQQARITDLDSGVILSLALDNDTLAIGAPFNGIYDAPQIGVVYVYTRTGTAWAHQQTINATVRTLNTGDFGMSLDIEGDRLAIGAPDEDWGAPASGAVYLYQRSEATWSLETTLLPLGGAQEMEEFGESVALDGHQLAVGAPGWSSQTGAVYVWTLGGSTWTPSQRIVAPDGRPGLYGGYSGDLFGLGLALAGDTLVVGAPYDNDRAWYSGSVYILRRIDDMWVFQRKMTAPDAVENGIFGQVLAVDGGRAVVGTPGDGSSSKGGVYAFDLGYVTPVATPLSVSAPGILVNDSMPDPASATAAARTAPAHGALAMEADSSFTYAPSGTWKGNDTFTYACADGSAVSNAAVVVVQTWQPTKLALRATDPSPGYARPTTLRATLTTPAGRGISGQAIVFEARSGAKWVSVGSATTDSHGVASRRVASVTTGRAYRARTSFSATYGAAGSDQVLVVPHVSLATPVTPVSVARSRAFTVSGSLKPHHKAGTKPVQLRFYHLESGIWVFNQAILATVRDHSGYSQYSARASLALSGRWQVRAYHPGDTAGAATWSGRRYLTVR